MLLWSSFKTSVSNVAEMFIILEEDSIKITLHSNKPFLIIKITWIVLHNLRKSCRLTPSFKRCAIRINSHQLIPLASKYQFRITLIVVTFSLC